MYVRAGGRIDAWIGHAWVRASAAFGCASHNLYSAPGSPQATITDRGLDSGIHYRIGQHRGTPLIHQQSSTDDRCRQHETRLHNQRSDRTPLVGPGPILW